MIQIKSVLIADEIEQQCVDVLKSNGIEVVKKTKLPKEELIAELQKHDAVVVRSATKVTEEVIEKSAGKLKLIGRAGTGVDNIDVEAAKKHGVLVMNTPDGNSRSAAELTSTLILSLARHVPQAAKLMKDGKWRSKDYMGSEVNGKTLAIIGLGRIGQIVAQQMQAFGMKIIGYDPMVKAEDASKLGIEWLPLEQIWPLADYITVHVPLIAQTKGLIGRATLAKCKPTVYIVNVARGKIVNEEELIEAIDNGKCWGAALDVFAEEPPTNSALVNHPKVICTPHLGASTVEAQNRVAVEIAENIVALNERQEMRGVLNAPKK